jgi:hypothetical protein
VGFFFFQKCRELNEGFLREELSNLFLGFIFLENGIDMHLKLLTTVLMCGNESILINLLLPLVLLSSLLFSVR